jgi:hypothetical protein
LERNLRNVLDDQIVRVRHKYLNTGKGKIELVNLYLNILYGRRLLRTSYKIAKVSRQSQLLRLIGINDFKLSIMNRGVMDCNVRGELGLKWGSGLRNSTGMDDGGLQKAGGRMGRL